MRRKILGAVLAAAVLAGAALAGPVTEFERAFGKVYASYRTALFMTNSGNAETSGASLAAFAAGWSALAQAYRAAPPPQYADDPLWPAALDEVDSLLAKARAEVDAGTLAAAHETLEGIREVVSALHLRNGIQTFSDRMNAYHAEMEHVLALDPALLSPADLPDLIGRAAVLSYLAGDIAAHPPTTMAEDPAFAPLLAGFRASVDHFEQAARRGDLEAVKAAMAGLKKPYAMLFLKFG